MGRHTALTDAEFELKVKQVIALRAAEKLMIEVGFKTLPKLIRDVSVECEKMVVRERERRLREAKQ